MAFEVSTRAFPNGGEIPVRYTCRGTNLSPELHWRGVAHGARSVAIIMDDPDAPTGVWTHWIMWNIPPSPGELPEGIQPSKELEDGACQGVNSFKRIGYGGPCPPPGKAHRYYFRVFALDVTLDLPGGSSRVELENAMKSHVLSIAEWMGTFRR